MVQNPWYHLGIGAPPILEPISVGIGMFTGGTIWVLTHGHLWNLEPRGFEDLLRDLAKWFEKELTGQAHRLNTRSEEFPRFG